MFKSKLKIAPHVGDQRQGSLNAPITLVEYGDYQCSPCRKLMPMVDNLKKHFGDDLCVIFRHFPLKSVHRASEFAAIAAEAAGLQGQFWDMHQVLFKNQNQLNTRVIKSLGASLNLSSKQFLKDLELPQLAEKVRSDFSGGVRSGVNGTPCFYINEARYAGLHVFEMMRDQMEEFRKPKGLFSFLS